MPARTGPINRASASRDGGPAASASMPVHGYMIA